MPETRPPRDNLVRAVFPQNVELRESEADGGMPTMAGHFAVFDRWTEVDSSWEGHFMERIAPGSFTKTIKENRDRIRVTFNHGHDPHLGDKVLGPIDVLREEATGPYYEVPLLDTSYNRDLIPGLKLKTNGYGASFRFNIPAGKDDWERNAKTSDHNPDGLPERTIREVFLHEFGPVTYPAYIDATAGIRSLTDDYFLELIQADPDRVRALFKGRPALLVDGAEAKPHSDEGSRGDPMPTIPRLIRSDADWDAILEGIAEWTN